MKRNSIILLVGLALAAFTSAANAQDLVANGPRATLNLNGEWQTAPHQGLDFKFPPPSQGWKSEKVPQGSASLIPTVRGPYDNKVNTYLNKEGTAWKTTDTIAAWFKRDFTFPARDLSGKRAILHFHGMAFRSEAWFNGHKLGTSLLGQLPIDYDVTQWLKPGAKNQIVVGLTGREGVIDIANKTFIAPVSGVQAGIWGDVELRLIPALRLDDVFIKTSVTNQRLDLETTLINQSAATRTVRPQVVVTDEKGTPQLNISSAAVTLKAGESKVVTLSKSWANPDLWTTTNPALYFARLSLQANGGVEDEITERFGFRQFEVRGTDFLLNGARIVLLRNSFLTPAYTGREGSNRTVRSNLGRPYNTARLHLGFAPEGILDAADKSGLMLIPESSWHNMSGRFELSKRALWLPQVADYTRRFIKLHRNHPSVIMWSLTNESIWGDTTPAQMEIADALVAAARQTDPTRPLQGDGEVNWGGRLDVINLHYPESTSGDLRRDYPNASVVEPNDLYWLKKGADNTSWRAQFKWDRPLILGEYWYIGTGTGSVDDLSSFMGEAAYDWEKWGWQSFGNEEGSPDSPYSELVKKSSDAYRVQGVAGLNPWSGDRNQIIPQVAVRPLDFHPNFFSGMTTPRKVVVFNDSSNTYIAMTLNARLTVGDKTVWQKSMPADVPSGSFKTFEIPIAAPASSAPQKAVLTVRLLHSRGEASRYVETIYLMPKARWNGGTQGIVLLDSSGQTAKALAQIGLTLAPKSTLSAADLANARALIIGQNTSAAASQNIIEAFVNRGGKVLVLRQDDSDPLFGSLPEIDRKHLSTRAWKRAYAHPVTAPFEEAQFSYWRPDNLVSTRTLNKPSTGAYKILLDAGGLYGLRWAGLVETGYDKGFVMQSQLNLLDDIGQEPMAGQLLSNLIQYCAAATPLVGAPLRLLSGDNAPLQQALQAASIVTQKGLTGSGPVLLDASYAPSEAELSALQKYVQSGGKLWLHGFTPQSVGKIAALLPFKAALAPFDATAVQGAARRSDDALISNLSSFDFHWTRINIGSRDGYFGAGQPTAKLGEYVLQLPNLEAGEKLIEPGLLVKVPSGKGTILFDTLLWEGALGGEADKTVRVVSSLATNLGASVQLAAEKSYGYFQVDLKPHANRDYVDEVAGDGKGGWTDQGPSNDLRYFLINHTGLAQGMEVGVGDFPASVVFAARPFTPIDPKKNGGRAAVVLRGQGHDPAAPAQVTGVAVKRKADKLWFLHAASWAGSKIGEEIGRYIIHYSDGTQSVFPIRNKIEIADVSQPAPLPRAQVGWVGRNDNELRAPIGLYVTAWNNPRPQKIIDSIDVVGDLAGGQLVLLGITGGVESAAQNGG